MALHRTLGVVDIHIAHSFEYANSAARAGATGLVAADVGRVARQLDDNTFWVLQNHSPATWARIDNDPLPPSNMVLLPVRNETGGTLLKGRLVVAVGYSVLEARILVDYADKDVESLRPCVAVLVSDLLDGTNDNALISGVLTGVDTSAFSLTDQLVLGNAGAFSRPPPDQSPFSGEVQAVGSVSRVHATLGEIVVSCGTGLDTTTGDQVFALIGTAGTPSDINRYVTNADARNTNARTPTGAAGGQLGGAYPNPDVRGIRETSGPTNLTVGALTDGAFLKRSGSSIVGVASPFDIRDLLVWDHFLSGNADTDELGLMGWRVSVSGVGASVSVTGESGHPGVVRLEGGTSTLAVAAVHLGDSVVGGNTFIAGPNPLEFEALVKLSGSVSVADLEIMQIGLGLEWTTVGEMSNGIYVRVAPVTSPNFSLVTANGGVRTVVIGTTAAALNVWFRVGFEVTFPGGIPTVQLKINGANQGSAITTNIPTAALGAGQKIDSLGGATEPVLLVDYVRTTQNTKKED